MGLGHTLTFSSPTVGACQVYTCGHSVRDSTSDQYAPLPGHPSQGRCPCSCARTLSAPPLPPRSSQLPNESSRYPTVVPATLTDLALPRLTAVAAPSPGSSGAGGGGGGAATFCSQAKGGRSLAGGARSVAPTASADVRKGMSQHADGSAPGRTATECSCRRRCHTRPPPGCMWCWAAPAGCNKHRKPQCGRAGKQYMPHAQVHCSLCENPHEKPIVCPVPRGHTALTLSGLTLEQRYTPQ